MNYPAPPSRAGSSGMDSPNLTGWGIAAISGIQEKGMDQETWSFLSRGILMPGDVLIESPIERAFYRCCKYLELGFPLNGMTIERQVTIGKYRVDFAFVSPGGKVQLIVECDGHDFHDGDRAAAARDKERDRWMATAGYTVFRFTGSQIYEYPFGCAGEAIAFAVRKAKAESDA